jgi:U3 small nucleolar RNA-associated protein 15
VVGQSIQVDELLGRLKKKVDDELAFQRQMMELLGSLDLILTSNTLRAPSVAEKQLTIPDVVRKESAAMEQ